jgi:hypothetical protein
MEEAIAVTAADVQASRDAATRALIGADRARELALDIDRRRSMVVHRHDAAIVRHVPETWSSAAATVSREELHHTVAFSLWATGEALRSTILALDHEAVRLDGVASTHRHRADRLAADLAVAERQATRSVSSTSLDG